MLGTFSDDKIRIQVENNYYICLSISSKICTWSKCNAPHRCILYTFTVSSELLLLHDQICTGRERGRGGGRGQGKGGARSPSPIASALSSFEEEVPSMHDSGDEELEVDEEEEEKAALPQN